MTAKKNKPSELNKFLATLRTARKVGGHRFRLEAGKSAKNSVLKVYFNTPKKVEKCSVLEVPFGAWDEAVAAVTAVVHEANEPAPR